MFKQPESGSKIEKLQCFDPVPSENCVDPKPLTPGHPGVGWMGQNGVGPVHEI